MHLEQLRQEQRHQPVQLEQRLGRYLEPGFRLELAQEHQRRGHRHHSCCKVLVQMLDIRHKRLVLEHSKLALEHSKLVLEHSSYDVREFLHTDERTALDGFVRHI